MILPYNEHYSYEILENGYKIMKDNKVIIEQLEPYGKMFKPDGTYEENCLIQIEPIAIDPEPEPYVPTEEEIMRADIDYLALMTDVELPSQGGDF